MITYSNCVSFLYLRPDNHCVNRQLTRQEKLDLIASDTDHNHDNIVTADDIAYDLNNNYDTDKDGLVTRAEWVLRWVCAYADTVSYARWMWMLVSDGAKTITADQFRVPPFDPGMPLDQFRDLNDQRYDNFALQNGGTVIGK